MKKFEVENHAESIIPDGDWELVWSDEFDGEELDMTKWDYRLSMMGKRHITWGTEGVKLDGNSNAVFTVYEKDGEICSSQLQTGYNFMDAPHSKESLFGAALDSDDEPGLVWPIGKLQEHKYLKKYGYFECRCKLQKKEGWWSAFWLQSPVIGSSLDPATAGIENDIMESFHVGKIIQHANIYNGYGEDNKTLLIGEGMDISLDEYHRFGMLWDENGYTFYVDGREDGHVDSPVSHIPQFILISTEVNGYRTAKHTATDEARAAVGDEFIVDYVRVFDKIK